MVWARAGPAASTMIATINKAPIRTFFMTILLSKLEWGFFSKAYSFPGTVWAGEDKIQDSM
jgi:hypothetical protein